MQPLKALLRVLACVSLFSAHAENVPAPQPDSPREHARSPAAEWQFAVETESGRQQHRAFLWIPPECRQVRGIILGQQVILEHNFLEDPQIREAARCENLAIVLLSPFTIGYVIDDKTAAKIQKTLTDLATLSGYSEIANAPLLTVGHSGGGIWAWNIAYQNPARSFGIVTIKSAALPPPVYAPKSSVDGIPTLSVSGQYETWGVAKNPAEQISAEQHWRWLRGDLLAMRGKNRVPLNSELVEPGVTHFGWAENLARYIALFIRKAAQARIPSEAPSNGQPVALKTIPLESGWLGDCTFMTPSRYEAASYKEYQGDPYLAMWHLDSELAKANDGYSTQNKGKKLQIVTFVEGGKPLQPAWIESMKFRPLDDGVSVKVTADFVKETPPELSFPKRQSLGHAGGPIQFRLIGGWTGGGEQTGPDTFRIRMDRLGYTRGYDSLMIMAFHPGDEEYGYCEQPVSIAFPRANDQGTPQTINFPAIPDQKAGSGSIALQATCDSGRPVEYLVLCGPAIVDGNILTLTALPARIKLPVKATVIAYQWGRSVPPLFKSAAPVERSFNVEP